MPGFKERHEPSEARREGEKRRRPDASAERRKAFSRDLADARLESQEAEKAVHEARLRAAKLEGHLDPESKRELEAMEAEADAIAERYASLSKKARGGGIGEEIAEELVTHAIIDQIVPGKELAKLVEQVMPIAKVAFEDEETPAEKRRKEREKRKDGG